MQRVPPPRDPHAMENPLIELLMELAPNLTELGWLLARMRTWNCMGAEYALILELNPSLWVAAEIPESADPALVILARCGDTWHPISRKLYPGDPKVALVACKEVARTGEYSFSYAVTASQRHLRALP